MVDERDRAGRTALHYAATDGNLEDVQRLLAESADVNAQEVRGWTPLHFAADQGNLDIVQVLLDAGANVHLVNNRGEEALFRSVANGGRGQPLATTKLLLSNGADPHLANCHGRSPAEFAKRLTDSEITALFADEGT